MDSLRKLTFKLLRQTAAAVLAVRDSVIKLFGISEMSPDSVPALAALGDARLDDVLSGSRFFRVDAIGLFAGGVLLLSSRVCVYQTVPVASTGCVCRCSLSLVHLFTAYEAIRPSSGRSRSRPRL